jgi:hypothetical protein
MYASVYGCQMYAQAPQAMLRVPVSVIIDFLEKITQDTDTPIAIEAVDKAIALVHNYTNAITFKPHWRLLEQLTRTPLKEYYHWNAIDKLRETVLTYSWCFVVDHPNEPLVLAGVRDLVAMQIIAAQLLNELFRAFRRSPPYAVKPVMVRMSTLECRLTHEATRPWKMLLLMSRSDCAWCRRHGEVGKPWYVCKRCRCTRYCSRKHQKKDWKYQHRRLCAKRPRRITHVAEEKMFWPS